MAAFVRPQIVLNARVVRLQRFTDARLALPVPRHARDETICQTEPKAVYITLKAGRQQKMLQKTFVLCLIDITS
jgi:hypothetical protein